ncbi:hypothetical protein QM012_005356 [Aureobasidium pullulans]|uniref:N-acetyltransferase domain-containing protein n=1 Tax=Aureobasidium pullulans TaxID=5580 RepID=A0ABR0T4U8_AURPU
MAERPSMTSQAEGKQMLSSEPAFIPSTKVPLQGEYVTLATIEQRDISALWNNLQSSSASQSVFHFLPWRTPQNATEFQSTIEQVRDRGFVLFGIYADSSRLSASRTQSFSDNKSYTEILGMIGYLDISPPNRTLELGAVIFSPLLQRTTAATEAHYLMLKYAFEGLEHSTSPSYRRVAWKCNSANYASRKAAERLGFVYEGTWRNHMVVRGVSRDSDWLSIVDEEWPRVKRALEIWLHEDNFGDDGRQVRTLGQIRDESKAEG